MRDPEQGITIVSSWPLESLMALVILLPFSMTVFLFDVLGQGHMWILSGALLSYAFMLVVPLPIRVRLGSDGWLRVRQLFRTQMIEVHDIRRLSEVGFFSGFLSATRVGGPRFVVEHASGRLYIPKGPFGTRHLIDALVSMNPDSADLDDWRGRCRTDDDYGEP